VRARRPLALLLAAAALTGGGCASPTSGGDAASGVPPDQAARVERVVDGDTIIVLTDDGRERVRLTGIDTPESVKPDSPVECFGLQASAKTKELLDGRDVRLEFDTEVRDPFDRLLAYVFREPDGRFVNEALLRGGYATVFRKTKNQRYAERFIAAQETAKQSGAGKWGAC
jgi:micrococcal nuclease